MEAYGAGIQKAGRFYENRSIKQKDNINSPCFLLEFTLRLYYYNFIFKLDKKVLLYESERAYVGRASLQSLA